VSNLIKLRNELDRLYIKVGAYRLDKPKTASYIKLAKTWSKIAQLEVKWREAFEDYYDLNYDDYEDIGGGWQCDGNWHMLVPKSYNYPVSCLECDCDE